MKHHKLLPGMVAATGMLILILDSKTALNSAAEGIDLCIRAVIPSLFPFFLLSGILVGSFMGSNLPLLRPLANLLGMPQGSETFLISGFLGGYPVGASAIRDAWAAGSIRQEDAQRLLGFCNNAGPAFLFGMAAQQFSNPGICWILWVIHIVSAMISGIMLKTQPVGTAKIPEASAMSPAVVMKNALSVTAQVCGWVIAFRIINGFLNRWFLWFLPEGMQTAVAGFLELTNGCIGLSTIAQEEHRLILCSALLAFGGVCVWMQTASVTRGLSLRYFVLGKLMQTGFSLLFSFAWISKNPILWILPLPLLLLKKKKAKKCGNPLPAVV